MKDRSDDPSHYERTLLSQNYMSLHGYNKTGEFLLYNTPSNYIYIYIYIYIYNNNNNNNNNNNMKLGLMSFARLVSVPDSLVYQTIKDCTEYGDSER